VTIPEPAGRVLGWILLICIAFFSADTTAAMIEDGLRVAPKPLPAAPVSKAEANTPAQAVPRGMVELLATTEPEAPPAPAAAAAPGSAHVTPAPAAPPSSLKLRGTMAGVGGSGLAMIDVNGETRVISVGEDVSGMTLAEVTPYSARLEGGGRSQVLEMDVATELPAIIAQVTPPTDPNEDSAPSPSPSPGEAAADGTPSPDGTATPAAGAILSQRELRNILDNPGQFAGKGFRMKPVLREGEIVGMRVTMKDSSHPLARLGVQNGDIVRSLNGQELNGPEALSSIYRVLRNTSSLRFEVERNGQNQTIDVSLSE
jgi:general secretion pathway protein C